jgi:carboxypeptidase C (cathepsin A)
MKSTYLLLLSVLLNNLPPQDHEDDLVKSLPNFTYDGTIYSGYLKAGPNKFFHYMFNLAYEKPEEKPLVLWLNGGPGCSSMDGWAMENGPMFLNKDGTFTLNEYSWNKAANMLYIECPGNVGYSYIISGSENDLKIDDDIAAKDNLNALLSFFLKFPEYKNRDFYISGESYSGIYIPMLAYEIINYNKIATEKNRINLKGILIGNGLADWDYDDYKARNDFLFSHNLISYEHRLEYNDACFVNYNKKKCDEIVNKIAKITSNINYYNYLEECEIPKTDEGEVDYYSNYFLKNSFAFKNLKAKQRQMKSFKLKTFLSEKESNDYETLPVSCGDDGPIRKYFNRDDVKEALHVNKSKTWDLCSYSVYFSYYMQDKASIWAYQTLFENNIRILIFNGDVDIVVSYFSNQRWIESLGLEVLEPWRQWRAFDDKVNVAGYVEKYKELTFCTIKGAGHEVPKYKPKEAYYMFSKFINNEDL